MSSSPPLLKTACAFAALSFSVCAWILTAQPAVSQKTEADFIPPDVTLSTSGASSTRTSSAPGLSSPGASAAPGLANSSAPGAVGAHSITPPGMAAQTPRGPASAGGTYAAAHPSAVPGSHGNMFKGSGVKPDPNKPDPIATLETDKGVIKIMLFRRYAPITVENFIDIASRGFYNGKTFHRVEPGFCIQGGDPLGNGQGCYPDPDNNNQLRFLPLETSPQLKHNAPGVVAMAHSKDPNSGSCQFYITLAPKQQLDGMYSIFGGVVSGMDVVNSIAIGDKIRSVVVEEQQ